MNTSDWITLSGVIVSGIGVVVSAALTYAIMNLTKESVKASKANAEAAEKGAIAAQASYDLSKHVLDNQKRLEQALRKEYRNRVLKQAQAGYDLLVSLAAVDRNGLGNDDVHNIINRPRKPDLISENMIQYFSGQEIELIDKSWDDAEAYIKHWYNGNGNVYLPDASIRLHKAVDAINNMNNLIHILSHSN